MELVQMVKWYIISADLCVSAGLLAPICVDLYDRLNSILEAFLNSGARTM